ncbi:hypothetical protein SAMN05660826_01481 [Caldanaerovirga acetigignens]|jgi:hypothetical protein|uniref:Uncharacterized protein n=1 Tax=Caldanaerovirga acetigignens TaxID=447595 RepID=A0A1M7K9W7_9FIRM|nr:hypothetical protein [Caldanaerovirga acetigignens]SHM62005.1 hypothetical protein SAMN05660826_01481 [Caldanaerovirga acetigignens]
MDENKKGNEHSHDEKKLEKNWKKTSYNPYLLFLILILLVKSFEVPVSSKNIKRGALNK